MSGAITNFIVRMEDVIMVKKTTRYNRAGARSSITLAN